MIATVKAEIKKRIPNRRLVDLTNDDGDDTTINDTVLEMATTDAIGEFERITGLLHDDTNKSHIAILVFGTLYFLEVYKSRDANIIAVNSKAFYSGCQNVRKLLRISPQVSKENRIIPDSTPQPFDSETKRNVFNSTPMGASTIKYQNEV